MKNSSQTTSSFLEYVIEGGLIKPSEKILISFEKKIKCVTERVCQNVLNMLLKCYPNFLFEIDHYEGIESHKVKMIKNVVCSFVSLKLKHFAKQKRSNIFIKRVRRTMTKLVLFKNQ